MIKQTITLIDLGYKWRKKVINIKNYIRVKIFEMIRIQRHTYNIKYKKIITLLHDR